MAIERGDRRLQTFVGLHFNETKTAGPTGLTIRNHLCRTDRTVRSKHLLQISRGRGPGEVPHVNLPGHKTILYGLRN